MPKYQKDIDVESRTSETRTLECVVYSSSGFIDSVLGYHGLHKERFIYDTGSEPVGPCKHDIQIRVLYKLLRNEEGISQMRQDIPS